MRNYGFPPSTGALAEALPRARLAELNLSANGLAAGGAAALAGALRLKGCSLATLNLRCETCACNCMRPSVSVCVRASSLHVQKAHRCCCQLWLDTSQLSLVARAVERQAAARRGRRPVRGLSADCPRTVCGLPPEGRYGPGGRDNIIPSEGAAALAEALRHNESLTELDLSANPVRAKPCCGQPALRSLPSLLPQRGLARAIAG